MWQCRWQKRHIPERPCWTQRTARSSRARWSEFLQLLIKWKVKFQPSRLEGATAVCVAVEVLSVINFMKRGGFRLLAGLLTHICYRSHDCDLPLNQKTTREKNVSMEMDMIPTRHSFLNSTVESDKIQEFQNRLLCLPLSPSPPKAPALVSSIECTVKQLNRPESFNNLVPALCFCCPWGRYPWSCQRQFQERSRARVWWFP